MADPQATSSPALRVCYFGTYRAEYSRNRILIEGLRRNGVQVLECHVTLWQGIEDRVDAVDGGWRQPRFWWRLLQVYSRLSLCYLRLPDHQLVVVGYPGQLDVYLARLLTWLRRKPLVWDVFMSIYLIAEERGLAARSATAVTLLRRLERMALRLPDGLIQDTADYAAWLHRCHDVAMERFHLVPTGADTRLFRPGVGAQPAGGCFRVLYYGTFIPNHGVEIIVEAARLLQGDPTLHFELIGQGPQQGQAVELVQSYGLHNVTFIGWLEQTELLAHIQQADLCLGVFGTTPQSLMTVQNKIYECLAAGRPVVTGDGPAVRAALVHGEHLYLCARADPAALAQAIQTLRADEGLRQRLATDGARFCRSHYGVDPIGARFLAALQEHLPSHPRQAAP